MQVINIDMLNARSIVLRLQLLKHVDRCTYRGSETFWLSWLID